MSTPHSQRPIVVFPDADDEALDLLAAAQQVVDTSGLDIRIHMGIPQYEAEWLSRVEGADAILLGWSIPASILDQCPTIKLISYLGTDASTAVDASTAQRNNVTVRCVVGYGDDAVAEHALALLLAAVRSIPQLNQEMKSGTWPATPSRQLRDGRLGVVGLGGIGRRMVELGRGIGMEVVAWNRSAEHGATEIDGIRLAPLDEILESCDAVSLHVPLMGETRGFIDARRLALMKPHAVLVNTARGAVIDREALLAALDSGHLHAVALDVFEIEPADPDDRLVCHQRTIVTPHTAFNTFEASQRLFESAVSYIVEFFD